MLSYQTDRRFGSINTDYILGPKNNTSKFKILNHRERERESEMAIGARLCLCLLFAFVILCSARNTILLSGMYHSFFPSMTKLSLSPTLSYCYISTKNTSHASIYDKIHLPLFIYGKKKNPFVKYYCSQLAYFTKTPHCVLGLRLYGAGILGNPTLSKFVAPEIKK